MGPPHRHSGRREKRREKMKGLNEVGKRAWLGQEQNQEDYAEV